MAADIKVGIAEYKISKAPNRLITFGLGSCVGISIYDRFADIGGLAHIMLPDSTQFKNVEKAEKFADLAIPMMVKELTAAGVQTRNLVAKIAGGASMFQFPDKNTYSDIGSRNILAVRASLKRMGIPILAEDTGGRSSRTMILDLADKSVIIIINGNQTLL